MKIHLLSEETINKIAAGEVIESPVSVVKELVENAVDAAATNIVIEILGGGLQMVRVSDNGTGMDKADAMLCLKKHATSKIKEAEDLFEVKTMGFRGEALSSIAAISKMTLTTSDGSQGHRIEIEGGKVISCDPYPCNRGTKIEVRHLFYNTPARRKFQKSQAASAAEISRAVTMLALCYPSVGFELVAADKSLIKVDRQQITTAKSLSFRIRDLFGEQYLSSSVAVDVGESPYSIWGVVGSPSNTRPTRQSGFVFLNGRYVTCNAVTYAVKEAFGTRIATDRYPVFVLHLTLPESIVDVNVHPQKKEVRISDEHAVRSLVKRGIETALTTPQQSEPSQASPRFQPAFDRESFFVIEAPTFFEEVAPTAQHVEQLQIPLATYLEPFTVLGVYLHLAAVQGLGKEGGLFLVDLHAAKRKVLFEDMLKAASSPIPSQRLLIPISFTMRPYEIEQLVIVKDLLLSSGFAFEVAGKDALLVDAVPSFLPASAVSTLFVELATALIDLDSEGRESLEEKKIRKIARIASRQSIGATPYDLEAAKKIILQLMASHDCMYDPDGNPILVFISDKQISSLFKKG